MNAEIIAVGTELLMGQIANTNAQYLSSRLADLGINVYYHSVVGDNPGRLKVCLEQALERSDIVITTGGLGPTKDDLTKETIAEALELPLVIHQESLDYIRCFLRSSTAVCIITMSNRPIFLQDAKSFPTITVLPRLYCPKGRKDCGHAARSSQRDDPHV